MAPTRLLVCLLAVTMLGTGCGGSDSSPEPLRVAAASDLQDVLPEIARRFHEAGGPDVEITFGASGNLAAQIKAGAPFDVFLSANRAFVDKLAESGVIQPESVRPYTTGALVLVVNRKSGVGVETLADLLKPDIKKVALANPEIAPYGAAARQALQHAKLWDALEGKLVRLETVRQTLQSVQEGNAEAGLVGRSVARTPKVQETVRAIEIDPALYDPIVQGLGIVARSQNPDKAEAFSRFVLGPVGQATLKSYGFGSVPDR